MTRKEAQHLMEDLGKNHDIRDYTETVYVSIKDVGTKVFKRCAYFKVENFTFIWTETESFMMDANDMGDCVIIPYDHNSHVSHKNAT